MNLPLPVSLRTYCGVDLKNVYSSNASVQWDILKICMMGLKPSPYLTTQSMGWLGGIIQGYYRDCDNPFQWENIHLNFPGDSKYSHSLPWV